MTAGRVGDLAWPVSGDAPPGRRLGAHNRTFSDPVRIIEVADGADMYPICADRQTLDDMCARVDAAGTSTSIHGTAPVPRLRRQPERNGRGHNTDVLVSKSTDGRATWSPVQQINTSEDDQFFPWLSVARDQRRA
jgi:hypothetical protein